MSWHTTAELVARGYIPQAVGDRLRDYCPVDGYPIIRNLNLTLAKCSNTYCPIHLSHRTDSLFKYLNILKGVGQKTIQDILTNYQYKSPFQVLDHYVKLGQIPVQKMFLWEVALFSGVEGIATKLREEFGKCSTVAEYLQSKDYPHEEIIKRAQNIEFNTQFVELKKPLSNVIIKVMITGSLEGYTREEYIRYLNSISGDVIQVVNKGESMSNHFLITQYPEHLKQSIVNGVASRKAMAATRAGTMIVSPRQFEHLLAQYMVELLEQTGQLEAYINEKRKEGLFVEDENEVK